MSAAAAGSLISCNPCVYTLYEYEYEKYMEKLAEYELMCSSSEEDSGSEAAEAERKQSAGSLDS